MLRYASVGSRAVASSMRSYLQVLEVVSLGAGQRFGGREQGGEWR